MILVLGGTEDGNRIIAYLARRAYPVLATATTDYGTRRAHESGAVETRTGEWSPPDLRSLLQSGQVWTVVDATHPYASRITELAHSLCTETSVPYLRWRRKATAIPRGLVWRQASNWPEAAREASCWDGPIFFAAGSHGLAQFRAEPAVRSRRVIARVLPDPVVIGSCLELGLAPADLVAMTGPFGRAVNRALFAAFGVSVLITKDGGAEGGTPAKLLAARDLQLPTVILRRPQGPPAPNVQSLRKLERFLRLYVPSPEQGGN